ncbi:uncharacterized protein NPIL_283201 [Nephila pilipes]|uniref:Uncharacterized protein n=1 Tax=Nephila pilipes TaxID=299642 RepID=A0A8X6U0L9_NEPPI|nr:uncharacterized protein NPIL_283201 [Nephila pilipes]
MFWVSAPLMMCCIGGTFVGYYYCVCICIKSCVTKFVLKCETLISQCDYQRILNIHEDISRVMALANELLSYPAFINVLYNMGLLFTHGYDAAFKPSDDHKGYFNQLLGIIQISTLLILLMLPAAGCNRALNLAQETINSLPGRLPHHRKVLKMHILQKHSKTFPLTLWNIYVIDESLLISAFGTLLTYGFLVGNIKNGAYNQEPKHYDSLSITSWLTFGEQRSFNPPWHGCHKSLIDDRRQIVPDV